MDGATLNRLCRASVRCLDAVVQAEPEQRSSTNVAQADSIYVPPPLRRPLPIYFVAAWSFVILNYQTHNLTLIAIRLSAVDADEAKMWEQFSSLFVILLIWHAVRLIQLRVVNRWLAAASFAWITVGAIYALLILAPKAAAPFRFIAVGAVLMVPSLAGCLYLVHPRFRQRAVQFAAQQQRKRISRMMQKASQRAVLRDLKNFRK